MNESEANLKIRKTVRSIFSFLDLNRHEILDILEITDREFAKKQSDFSLDLLSLEKLCAKLNISFDHLYKQDIDYSTLLRHFRKDSAALPEKYSDIKSKMARARTVMGIYNYLQTLQGPLYAAGIFRKIQVYPHIFSDPDELISIRLVQDLITEIAKSKYSQRALIEMGRNALNINKSTAIEGLLRRAKSPKDAYEKVHQQILGPHYDRIFNYQLIYSSSNSVKMVTTIKEEALDLLKERIIGNREMCVYKQGVYGSFLGHVHINKYKLIESDCLYSGGSRCMFHLSW